MPPLQLSELEQTIVANCANPGSTKRRIGSVVFTALTFAILASYAVYRLSPDWVFGLVMLYIGITSIEKILYGRAVLVYKQLIGKLLRRLDELGEPAH